MSATYTQCRLRSANTPGHKADGKRARGGGRVLPPKCLAAALGAHLQHPLRSRPLQRRKGAGPKTREATHTHTVNMPVHLCTTVARTRQCTPQQQTQFVAQSPRGGNFQVLRGDRFQSGRAALQCMSREEKENDVYPSAVCVCIYICTGHTRTRPFATVRTNGNEYLGTPLQARERGWPPSGEGTSASPRQRRL